MADTKISALPAATALDSDDILHVVEDGVDKKVTMAQLDAYTGPVRSVATATQALLTVDSYVTSSRIIVPQNRMQTGALYRARMVITKGAAGTVAPIFVVRGGTGGSTADAAILTYTGPAQTAVADTGFLEVQAVFRAHSATVGQVSAWLRFDHDLAATGFANATRGFQGHAASAANLNTTAANFSLGVSMTSGTAATWTIQQCYAELVNLAN